MRKLLTGAIFGLAMSVSGSVSAGILDGVDILNIDGIFESSLAAGNMTEARATLVNEGATVTDVNIGAFSAADLAGIDILYVGLVSNGFTNDQINTITSYVAGGGGIVFVGTERSSFSGPAWEEIGNALGLFGLGGDRAVNANPTTPTSPIVDGPFGVASSYAPAATGAFDENNLPPGTTIVWEGVDGHPVIVTLDVTGRAFSFADTNFMENAFIGNGDNRIIWGNAFAFTGRVDEPPEPGEVPAPAALGLLGFGLLSLAAIRRRRR